MNEYIFPIGFIIIFILIITKKPKRTEETIQEIVKQQSKEYLRGYNIVCKLIENGSDAESLLIQSNESLTNDYFDKGWKNACEEHIKQQKNLLTRHRVGK